MECMNEWIEIIMATEKETTECDVRSFVDVTSIGVDYGSLVWAPWRALGSWIDGENEREV